MKQIIQIIILGLIAFLVSCSKDNSEEDAPVLSPYAGYVVISNGDTQDDLNLYFEKDGKLAQTIKPGKSSDRIAKKELTNTIFYTWSNSTETILEKEIDFSKNDPDETIYITLKK